jgi:hypothetical protein
VGPSSPRHGATPGCGGRGRPPDREGSCEYIESVSNSRQGVVLELGTWALEEQLAVKETRSSEKNSWPAFL